MGLFDNRNKGAMGWIDSTPAPKHHHHHHVEVVNQTVNGKGVDYWHGYAQGLSEQLAEAREQIAALIENRDDFQKLALERKATDAGLRAVVRYLLSELRKNDPNSPLLDKKVRDRIFNEFHKEEMDKVLQAKNMQPWQPLKRPDERQSP